MGGEKICKAFIYPVLEHRKRDFCHKVLEMQKGLMTVTGHSDFFTGLFKTLCRKLLSIFK